jgi:hypothetical protein
MGGFEPGVVNRHLGIGWEFVHVCIDDASRIAFSPGHERREEDQRPLPSSKRRWPITQVWGSRSSVL